MRTKAPHGTTERGAIASERIPTMVCGATKSERIQTSGSLVDNDGGEVEGREGGGGGEALYDDGCLLAL